MSQGQGVQKIKEKRLHAPGSKNGKIKTYLNKIYFISIYLQKYKK